MAYDLLIDIAVGLLALIGGALLILFWILFPEDRQPHPIYRRDDPCLRASPADYSSGWDIRSTSAWKRASER